MTAPQPETSRFSGLKLRIVSGIVLAPLVLSVILYGGIPFLLMAVLAAGICFYEWYKMAACGPRPLKTLFIGAVYLSVCIFCLVFIRFGFEQGAWLAFSLMICVWASDTGAYFAGKMIGGPKLAPAISPKKTWAGFFGAMVACALSLELLLFLGEYLEPWIDTNIGLMPERGWWAVLISGFILGAVGQGGDLFESYFKRRSGLKDMGSLIPGHGGLLDRIDALLLVSPVFLLICMVLL